MGYCNSCGIEIPDSQNTCSMCVGDIDHGMDGYYEQYMRECMKYNESGILTESKLLPTGDYSGVYEAVLTVKDPENPIWIDFVINEPQYKDKPIMTGFVKWDGCMEISGAYHTCSMKQIRELNQFILEIYRTAGNMMRDKADRSAFVEDVYDLPF